MTKPTANLQRPEFFNKPSTYYDNTLFFNTFRYVERIAFETRAREREYQMLKEARLKSIQRR